MLKEKERVSLSNFIIIRFSSLAYQYYEELNYCVHFEVRYRVSVEVDEGIYTVD